jgi:hypothetical protein
MIELSSIVGTFVAGQEAIKYLQIVNGTGSFDFTVNGQNFTFTGTGDATIDAQNFVALNSTYFSSTWNISLASAPGLITLPGSGGTLFFIENDVEDITVGIVGGGTYTGLKNVGTGTPYDAGVNDLQLSVNEDNILYGVQSTAGDFFFVENTNSRVARVAVSDYATKVTNEFPSSITLTDVNGTQGL